MMGILNPPAAVHAQQESLGALLIEIREHVAGMAVEEYRFQTEQARSALDAIEPIDQARRNLVQLAVYGLSLHGSMNQARISAKIEQGVAGERSGRAEEILARQHMMADTAPHQSTVDEDSHHESHEFHE
jgi:hypothetical protein